MEELEAQLLIGEFEYLQLWSDTLAPYNYEYLLPNDTVEAVNVTAPPCHGPMIDKDSRTFAACVQWVEEIKQGVVQDDNFALVVAPYDMGRLKGVDVFEKSTYVETVLATIDEVGVVNSPPLWLVDACIKKKRTLTISTDEPSHYRGIPFPIVSTPGLELHNMSRAHSMALMPNPYHLIDNSAGVLSFTNFGNMTELVFVARSKVKKRYYLRQASIHYSLNSLSSELLDTKVRLDYPEISSMKFGYGDYYAARVSFIVRHTIAELRVQCDDLINRISLDNIECTTTPINLQEFQIKPPLCPQVCMAVRVSSMSCKFVVCNYNLYMSCNILLNEIVQVYDDYILQEGTKISYGNRYLYSIDVFLEDDYVSISLIDHDKVIVSNSYYSPQTYLPVTGVEMDNWEDIVIPDYTLGEDDIIFDF